MLLATVFDQCPTALRGVERSSPSGLRQKSPQCHQDPSGTFPVHCHPKRVSGLFALHRLDAFGHGANFVPIPHRSKTAEEQPQIQRQIFRQAAVALLLLDSKLGWRRYRPRQALQHVVLDQIQISAA